MIKKSNPYLRTLKISVPSLLLIIFMYGCKKDSTEPTNSSPQQANINTTTSTLNSALTSVPSGSYDLTASLPKGYVKNGTVDYTTYLQAAITKNSNVTFPNFPILVDDAGLSIPSNRTVNFLAGSQIWLKPTATGNYNILEISHASNVVINNPVIIGDAAKHLGTTGEWGMGISILSSSNIQINGANVSYCWGDGIYLSTSQGTTTNTNITISNAQLTYNRRDGMSITSVNGLDLESPYAEYSTGTSPMCGINFEPNSSTDELQNIVVNNAQTGYNTGYGIQIGYSNLYGGSNKTTSITVNNHTDKRSTVAFKTAADITKRKGSEIISGQLIVNNPEWRLNPTGALVASLAEHNLKLTITKPILEDASGTFLTQAAILSNLTYKTHMLAGSNYVITF
jgi:hypothetical protein